MLQQICAPVDQPVEASNPAPSPVTPWGRSARPRNQRPKNRPARMNLAVSRVLKLQALHVAAKFDVSLSEVLVQCLDHGIDDLTVRELIEHGKDRLPSDDEVDFLAPESVKNRLFEAGARLRVHKPEILKRCLQWGLSEPSVLAAIKAVAENRSRKLGRTVSQKDLIRAA